MKAFLILLTTVLLAIAIGVSVEAASPVHPKSLASQPGPKPMTVRVPARGPCPPSVQGYSDVANNGQDLRGRLLPAGALFGLICRYGQGPRSTSFALIRSALVNGRTALTFEQVISKISTKKSAGVAACPAQFATVTILAFGFSRRADVDLWYNDSGCQTLDNGFLEASEISNPPFFNRFIPLVAELSPAGGNPN